MENTRLSEKEMRSRLRDLKASIDETGSRIRRYSLDPRLRLRQGKGEPRMVSNALVATAGDEVVPKAVTTDSDEEDLGAKLREMTDQAWEEWMALRDALMPLSASSTVREVGLVERRGLKLDREVDLIQRELIGEKSFEAGVRTTLWLALALVLLFVLYLLTHNVHGLNFTDFEPWPEWGPLKYGEVAFWSSFGVLCYLLFLATRYLLRRDFDQWYQPWYLSTALRAPFLAVILMLVILEFAEWYGEGTQLQGYILEEGNKFYFIVLVSFCLGLASDRTASIIRELSEGVTELVQRAVERMSQWLSSLVSTTNTPRK